AITTTPLTPFDDHSQPYEHPSSVVVIAHLNAPLLRVTEVNGDPCATRAPALPWPLLNGHPMGFEMVNKFGHVLFVHYQTKMVEIRTQWHSGGGDRFLQRKEINHRIGADADRRKPNFPLPKLLEALGLKAEHVGVKIQHLIHILDV